MTLKGKDVLRLMDLSPAELEEILTLAATQKMAAKDPCTPKPLAGKSIMVILEKPSLRTRVSFERGIFSLGAQPIVLTGEGGAFSRGESVKDTSMVLERYCDAIVLRTFAQEKLDEVAKWASIPVVNALSDDFHPCQGLADLLTIREHKGAFKNLTVAYVGDGNNMAATYLEAGALTGMRVKVATPDGYEVSQEIINSCVKAAQTSGSLLEVMHDPKEAVRNADVVITDTWASMGEEAQHDARMQAFAQFQVDSDLMDLAAPEAIFMHCLPAHRGEEVTDEVADAAYSVIYDQAENRLHAQKALLTLLIGQDTRSER